MTEGEIIALIGMAGMIIVAVINAVSQNKTIVKRLDKIEKNNEKQYKSILRLTIMSEEMPISERIIAGKEYIDNGGNGDVKNFYKEFIEKHTK
jgi:hypothetical protein